MIRILLLSTFLMLSGILNAQKTDQALLKQLLQLSQGFQGQIGFYIKDLKSGRVAAYQADSVFPTASIVKVMILSAILERIQNGTLSYHQPLIYRDSLLYPGEDILGSFKNGERIELSKVIMLMCTTSDNTASLWLQSLAGTGTRINQLMDQQGLTYSRVNSRTPGREQDRQQFGWGQTTPAEMGVLFEKMARRQWISDTVSERMLKILSRNYWDEEALSQIPAGVAVASKNGAVDASRSEVMYVNAKRRSYIFSVFTKNNADKSWQPDNEAWRLTRKMSALVWAYFNGK